MAIGRRETKYAGDGSTESSPALNGAGRPTLRFNGHAEGIRTAIAPP